MNDQRKEALFHIGTLSEIINDLEANRRTLSAQDITELRTAANQVFVDLNVFGFSSLGGTIRDRVLELIRNRSKESIKVIRALLRFAFEQLR